MKNQIRTQLPPLLAAYNPADPTATAAQLRDLWLQAEPKSTAGVTAEQRAQQEHVGTPVAALKLIGKECGKLAKKRVDDFIPLARLLWDDYGREGRIVSVHILGPMELTAPDTLLPLIMDLCRFAVNPRVHLFFGARYRCELYDLPTLWQVASHNPWLSVSPVSEYSADPVWAADYPDVTPPRGLHVRQTGRLPDVVTKYGGWGDRQILICGGPAMVRATKAALIAKGAPPVRIQHDPLTT